MLTDTGLMSIGGIRDRKGQALADVSRTPDTILSGRATGRP